jgi:hypothetical protein
MDTAKIGLLVAGIAIILAVPLSVVANLLTPRLQSWYSTTSSKRLKKRMLFLESELRASEQKWTFTASEWVAYKAGFARFTSQFAVMAILCNLLMGGILIGLTLYERSFGERLHLGKQLLVPAISLGSAVICLVMMIFITVHEGREFAKNRSMHSAEGREAIRKEISKLMTIEKSH